MSCCQNVLLTTPPNHHDDCCIARRYYGFIDGSSRARRGWSERFRTNGVLCAIGEHPIDAHGERLKRLAQTAFIKLVVCSGARRRRARRGGGGISRDGGVGHVDVDHQKWCIIVDRVGTVSPRGHIAAEPRPAS